MPLAQARRKRSRNPGKIDNFVRASDIDSYVKTLLHLNGAHASTTITDSSPTPKTWTAAGTAALSTVQKKFGTASLNIAAAGTAGHWISTPDHADFEFLAADFTMELFFRMASIGGAQQIPMITKLGTAAGSQDAFLFQYLHTTNIVRINWTSNGATFLGPASFTMASPFSIDQWYHIVMERQGTMLRCFIDGVEITPAVSIGSTSIYSGTGIVKIGATYDASAYTFNAFYDEVRISNGIARYTENFVPPTGEFY